MIVGQKNENLNIASINHTSTNQKMDLEVLQLQLSAIRHHVPYKNKNEIAVMFVLVYKKVKDSEELCPYFKDNILKSLYFMIHSIYNFGCKKTCLENLKNLYDSVVDVEEKSDESS